MTSKKKQVDEKRIKRIHLHNVVASLLAEPGKTTTIITKDEKGPLAIIHGLMDAIPELKQIWQPIYQNYLELSVSIDGITREQLLKLVVQKEEEIKPAKEPKKLEII